MKSEFFVQYGCYLGEVTQHVAVLHDESVPVEVVLDWLQDEFWNDAVEETSNWYGLHGFVADDEEDEDAAEEMIRDHAEVLVEIWDHDAHIGRFCGEADAEVAMELEYVV
jgi:hypothetical protein